MKRFFLIVLSVSFCEAFSQEMTFTSIEPVPTIKRGREYEVNWQGGSREDSVSIVLVDKRSRQVNVATTTNTGKSVVRIPSGTRPGRYWIKIVNQTTGIATPSGDLRIRRRIPLVLQLSPLVVIPVAIVLISKGQPITDEISAVPNPPDM